MTRRNSIIICSLLAFGIAVLVLAGLVAEGDNNLFLSSRNIKDSNVVRAAELNTYEIMNAKHIVFEEGAIKNLEENLK